MDVSQNRTPKRQKKNDVYFRGPVIVKSHVAAKFPQSFTARSSPRQPCRGAEIVGHFRGAATVDHETTCAQWFVTIRETVGFPYLG